MADWLAKSAHSKELEIHYTDAPPFCRLLVLLDDVKTPLLGLRPTLRKIKKKCDRK